MARFYLTGVDGRGNSFSHGGRASVDSAHVRGWNAGVEVDTVKLADGDRLDVYMTPGSTGAGHRVLIGQVVYQAGDSEPRFIPAESSAGKSTLTDIDGWKG